VKPTDILNPFYPGKPTLPPRPKLAFVETSGDVRQTLPLYRRGEFDGFVAMDPDAAWLLWKEGVPYLRLEDGYDEMDLYQRADGVLAEQAAWAKQIDQALQSLVPDFGQAGFRPAYMYLHYLKLLFDAFYSRSFILQQVFERWQPRGIWYIAGELPPLVPERPLIFSSSIYPLSFPQMAARREIEMHPLPRKEASLRSAFYHPPPVLSVLRTIRRTALQWQARWKRPSMSSNGSIRPLLIHAAYDLKAIADEALRKKIPILNWDEFEKPIRTQVAGAERRDIAQQMAAAWKVLYDTPAFRSPTQPLGFDFWPLAELRLKRWWHVIIPEQWVAFEAARRHATSHPLAGVALPNLMDHVSRGILHGLKAAGVPSFLYQHGGFVGPCPAPVWDINDLWHADYELAYGDGTSDYFRSRRAGGNEIRAVPISVGSTVLERLVHEHRNGASSQVGQTVMLVPNVLPGIDKHLHCASVPDVTAAQAQASLVLLAREFPKFRFLFKAFHYQLDTPAVRLASEKGSNCRVIRYGGLLKTLGSVDAFILDFPSTALLQALATDRSVIVLVDKRFLKMDREALTLLRRRALVGETLEEFIDLARAFLSKGDLSRLKNPDDQFLKLYGTHVQDGKSVNRALDALLSKVEVTVG